MTMQSRERFLAALRGEAVDRPPVWLMRQAGRYLPGYRALRAEHSFWDVCQTPELSTRAALELRNLRERDAAIQSDFRLGVRLPRPSRSVIDYADWRTLTAP